MKIDEFRMCKRCGKETLHIIEKLDKGVHYSKIICVQCRSVTWGRKPKNEGKRKKNKFTPNSLGVGFCQMCLREKKNLLGAETLEIHHVVPIDQQGDDDPENIWVVCTPCHKMIHHHRTYLRKADGEYSH